MRRIRWGILGAGRIAQRWAEDLRRVPGQVLQAVQARDRSRAEAFAQSHGAARWTDSGEQLLSGGDLDAVYVATPHALHARGALACIRKGLPVLVEKPFSFDLETTSEVVLQARALGVPCMEALWTRFLPSFQHFVKEACIGSIGEPRRFMADFGFCAPPDPQSRLWDPAMGGGSLLDIGIYPLFVTLVLWGPPDRLEARAVRAVTGVDAACSIRLEWVDRREADLSCTFLENTPCVALLEGTNGRLILERMFHIPTTLTIENAEGVRRIPSAPGGHGYEYEITHFAEMIAQGRTESDLWNLDQTLALAGLLDRVRAAAGLQIART